MPSDSVAGFLDRAQANRVLFPEQVEQLIRQPDVPQSDLTALCNYLLTRGVVTQFQAAAIRESRGQELNFAGYPVIDEIGPCPGGIAYKVLHPSLRTPLVLRRLKLEWLAPDDSIPEYLNRARSFGMLIHSNVVPLLDAGVYQDEIYLVIDQPSDAAHLEMLIGEVGGAMPGFLAAEYGRYVASALRMAHERGGVHGDLRPENLIVGPLTVKKNPDGQERRRPAPNAVIRLMELGLVPIRPPATQYQPDIRAIPYLPPERLDSGKPGTRGDIYSLGATLFFLLAGRPPFEGSDANDLLNRVRSVEPTPLAALRPDLPAELTAFVSTMLDKRPEHRPETAADVMEALAPYCRKGSTQTQPVPLASPASDAISTPVSDALGVDAPTENESQPLDIYEWGAEPGTFPSKPSTTETAPRKREMTGSDKFRTRMYLILGGLLHLTGLGLFIAWICGAFDSTPPPVQEQPAPTNKMEKNKKKTKQNPNA
ncbi:MAG TPA: serine/threonine-protein kinase [Gemmata sp.]|jgi:serine/threonine protein kinase|nr:serine/threonine-protein kinase [Gemmata sp.]